MQHPALTGGLEMQLAHLFNPRNPRSPLYVRCLTKECDPCWTAGRSAWTVRYAYHLTRRWQVLGIGAMSFGLAVVVVASLFAWPFLIIVGAVFVVAGWACLDAKGDGGRESDGSW